MSGADGSPSKALIGPCEGRFAYQASSTSAHFKLAETGGSSPVETVVQFLAQSEVVAVAPLDAGLSVDKWKVRTERSYGRNFPAPVPESAATLPIRFRNGAAELAVEHWLDGQHSGRDSVKFWAGAGGYPGAALARDALSFISSLNAMKLSELALDPFSFSAPMDSSFRFDWRRDYIPLNAGFSPNDQPAVGMVGYPLVELLAAVGLQYARPARVSPRDKLAYLYHVSEAWLPTPLARAVLGGGDTGIFTRKFRMYSGLAGQRGSSALHHRYRKRRFDGRRKHHEVC